MDYKPHNRKPKHRKLWEFTFVGGTLEETGATQNQAQFTSDFSQESVFPLAMAGIGDRLLVEQILHREKDLKYHLSRVGLILGSQVQVVSKTNSGSVIIWIQDEQIGLGAIMANQVMVSLVTERN
ncbi:MAG TPA: FeoA family protein [Xenococcaceae cyanobacterium]